MAIKFSKKYEVNYYDVDYKLNCKLSSIVNFLCDIGNCQSEEVGETIEHLLESNSAWVFYKYDIRIKEYPKYREIINIETTPAGFNKFYAYRNYKITNSEGKLIGEATALFFLIDITKRRPKRIAAEQLKSYQAEDLANVSIDMEEVKKLEKVDNDKIFKIRYSDIDSNGHVNNVKYIEWAIEAVPLDIVKGYYLKRVKVVFEKEAKYGHNITAEAQIINNEDGSITTVHRIKGDEDNDHSKLELIWEREEK